jgi:hypothetical protein
MSPTIGGVESTLVAASFRRMSKLDAAEDWTLLSVSLRGLD